MRFNSPDLLQEANNIIKQKIIEKRMSLLFSPFTEISSFQLIDLKVSVVKGEIGKIEDVFVVAQNYSLTFADGENHQGVFLSFVSDSMDSKQIVPENEGKIMYTNDYGNIYPELECEVERTRNDSEETMMYILQFLDFQSDFERIKRYVVNEFKNDQNESFNQRFLPLFPFVKEFIYIGGATIEMVCQNGIEFPVSYYHFKAQVQKIEK